MFDPKRQLRTLRFIYASSISHFSLHPASSGGKTRERVGGERQNKQKQKTTQTDHYLYTVVVVAPIYKWKLAAFYLYTMYKLALRPVVRPIGRSLVLSFRGYRGYHYNYYFFPMKGTRPHRGYNLALIDEVVGFGQWISKLFFCADISSGLLIASPLPGG